MCDRCSVVGGFVSQVEYTDANIMDRSLKGLHRTAMQFPENAARIVRMMVWKWWEVAQRLRGVRVAFH